MKGDSGGQGSSVRQGPAGKRGAVRSGVSPGKIGKIGTSGPVAGKGSVGDRGKKEDKGDVGPGGPPCIRRPVEHSEIAWWSANAA